MTTPSAVRAPLAAVIEAAMPELGEDEQLALLPVPSALDDGRAEAVRELVKRDRAAGRPPGAKNLATRKMLDFIRQALGDPLLERARFAMHTPESLAKLLGCSKLEAFDRLDAMRADLSRFFYAHLAPVDGQGNAVVPFFNMQIGGAGAPGGPLRPPWEYAQPVDVVEAEKPANSTVPAGVSHTDVSHDGAK